MLLNLLLHLIPSVIKIYSKASLFNFFIIIFNGSYMIILFLIAKEIIGQYVNSKFPIFAIITFIQRYKIYKLMTKILFCFFFLHCVFSGIDFQISDLNPFLLFALFVFP